MVVRSNPFRLLPWVRHWSRAAARTDSLTGLTVAGVLIPGSMAYAQVAGVPTQIGLYAATIPVILYGLFGLVPSMSIGPIASASLLAGIAVGRADASSDDGAVVAMLALVCAAMFVVVAILRLDRLTARISRAALAGFISGIGVLIIATQLDSLVGLPADHPHTVWGDVVHVAQQYEQANWWTVGLTATTIVGVLLLGSHVRTVPAGLIAIVAGIAADSLFDLQDRGVDIVGALPSGLPAPSLPGLDGLTPSVVPIALGIVAIGIFEMSAILQLVEDHTGPADAHRETVALAVVSAGAGLFSAMPVTGSPSRSALAMQAGARTPFVAIVTGASVSVLLLVGTDWIEHLPIPVVASLVVVAGLQLIRPGRLRSLWHDDRTSGVIALVALAVTVVNVEAGVLAIVVASVAVAPRSKRAEITGAPRR